MGRPVGRTKLPSAMTPVHFRECRRLLGMSQSQLGAVLGLHGVTISGYERGKTPIPERIAGCMELFDYQQGEEARLVLARAGGLSAFAYLLKGYAQGKPSQKPRPPRHV